MSQTPQPTPDVDESLLREIFAAQGRSFRGGAVENLEGAPMGKGHGNAGQPFDIETACYLKPKFAAYDDAIRNGTRLKLVDKSGVKTLKSYALEVCAADHVCNRSGDVAIFFGTEAAAGSTSTTRILDHYKGEADGTGGIPRFRKKMDALRSRFDETMGAIKFPDKTLFILSANLGNTQQKNLAFVGLQDAFVTGASGMIKEMIARTTQYEKECIIYLESQGGEKGFDFDTQYEDTDQRELHTHCPHCGVNHIFNWKAFDEESMTRPPDFVATLPKNAAPELTVNELSEKLRGKVAGFKRGPDELIKLPDGNYNEAAILRETHFECFHCGSHWLDTPAIREQLDRSSNYIASRLDALPGNIGFNTPQWINRRLSWGGMMLEKLKAQRIAKEFGNYNDIKQWWQKVAARTWDQELFTRRASAVLSIGSYETDPAKLSYGAENHCRQMTVDCGKALDAEVNDKLIGTFWFEVRDFSKRGHSRQLVRGFVDSWALLAAQQKFWKVPNARTFVDSGWMPSQVEEAAVKHFELVQMSPVVQLPSCWRLMLGAGSGRRLTVNNKGVTYLMNALPGIRSAHDQSGRLWRMQLYKLTWSNLWFEQQFESIIGGGVDVDWEILPANKISIVNLAGQPDAGLTKASLDRESGKNASYRDQLDSRYYDSAKKQYLDYEKQSRPTEFRDCALMQLVGVAADGLLGHVAQPGVDDSK